jgi:hypothetical protein
MHSAAQAAETNGLPADRPAVVHVLSVQHAVVLSRSKTTWTVASFLAVM